MFHGAALGGTIGGSAADRVSTGSCLSLFQCADGGKSSETADESFSCLEAPQRLEFTKRRHPSTRFLRTLSPVQKRATVSSQCDAELVEDGSRTSVGYEPEDFAAEDQLVEVRHDDLGCFGRRVQALLLLGTAVTRRPSVRRLLARFPVVAPGIFMVFETKLVFAGLPGLQ